MSKQDGRAKIEKLVKFFGDNIYQLKSPDFNETQARQQLIDPFFEALGWDVHNRSMKPLFMQEVVPEGRVKTKIGREISEQPEIFQADDSKSKQYASILDYIAEDEFKASSKEAIKKPDYRFRINGQTKFFVEAKKPSVDLSSSQGAIFQVKRYGFSGRVPVSILTDFEEFRVFDCTQRPEFSRPKIGVIKEFDLTYKQYIDRFDYLFDTFSRDAVEGGSLDSLVKKQMQKRTGDYELDRTFLEDLSKWREELARDIAKHPKNRRRLNDYTLNESVQRILDRIVFFRVCEDREIEVENTLLAVLQMWKNRPGISLYSLLTDIFKQRRALYNGLLFSPHECEELEVGDEVLIKIIQNLNYPFSPYHFNEIGVEILGSIYEKFLGKTIHLTAKTTRIEEKPEVRKAGGVYYTPQYIVNYIVDNTLGKLLYKESGEGQIGNVIARSEATKQSDSGDLQSPRRTPALSPKEVAKLRIIDIACGSGSFLLGAFQKLIDYHLEWYTSHPKDIQTVQHVPDAYKDANGNLHLSARKKRDILVNNIYGVDIDRQAVEVTQMSLYLKVLEDENSETLNPQMTLALKEVYLPSLGNNIKCGNSLIGTDFAAQGELFDEETRHKVNPFDWETEFPEIMKNGGFDCVIGNPPYLFITELDEVQKRYFFEKYSTSEYRFDVYGLFIEASVKKLLTEDGYLGYIIPHTLLSNDSFEKLRKMLLDESRLEKVIDVGPGVFIGAKNETMILIDRKGAPKQTTMVDVIITDSKSFPISSKQFSIKQSAWRSNPKSSWLVQVPSQTVDMLSKIESKWKRLGDYCTVNQGLRTGNNDKYLSSKPKSSKWKPAAGGKEVARYQPLEEGLYVYYVPEVLDAPRKNEIFESPEKLVLQEIRNITLPRRLIATYDANQFYCLQSTNVINMRAPSEAVGIKYVLGILNSSTANFWFRQKFSGNNHIASNQVAQIPLPFEDTSMAEDLVKVVNQILTLYMELRSKQFDSEREPIERQIAATDKKIDELVYQLYGLTEEEMKVVEGK